MSRRGAAGERGQGGVRGAGTRRVLPDLGAVESRCGADRVAARPVCEDGRAEVGATLAELPARVRDRRAVDRVSTRSPGPGRAAGGWGAARRSLAARRLGAAGGFGTAGGLGTARGCLAARRRGAAGGLASTRGLVSAGGLVAARGLVAPGALVSAGGLVAARGGEAPGAGRSRAPRSGRTAAAGSPSALRPAGGRDVTFGGVRAAVTAGAQQRSEAAAGQTKDDGTDTRVLHLGSPGGQSGPATPCYARARRTHLPGEPTPQG